MAHIVGLWDTLDGEPSRTALRRVFLEALCQEIPGILPDLWHCCTGPARAVLATAGPRDLPEHLLCLVSPREADGGVAELSTALVEWAVGWRLTDSGVRRNRWLLNVALDTLRDWCAAYPDATDPPPGLAWSLPGSSYGIPFTPEERAVWDPLHEMPEYAEARLRADGMTRAEARAAVARVLSTARDRWHREDRERARPPVRVHSPKTDRPGPPAEMVRPALIEAGHSLDDADFLADLIDIGFTLEEAQGIRAELAEKRATTPLPDVPRRDRIRPAPAFRRRQHSEPAEGSELGRLARDVAWLAAYICTPRPVKDFAPNVTHATLVQRVREAARRCGFDPPTPLR